VPPRCYKCQKVTDDFKTCSTCRRRSPLFAAWAATYYTGPAKEVVHRLKFGRASAAANSIAEAMLPRLPRGHQYLVTHLPTATSRVRMRGYDQAGLIAKHIAGRLELPYDSLLTREGQSRQVGQKRSSRQGQMAGAFVPNKVGRIQGKHILLIDDVLTTGATLEAAGLVLREAGAARVSAAVFAVA